jgi:hypothetical protein
MEQDDRFIYFSFLFFLFTAGWIFLKRVKLIGLAQWFMGLGLKGIGFFSEVLQVVPDQTTVSLTTTQEPATTVTTIPRELPPKPELPRKPRHPIGSPSDRPIHIPTGEL